ncbi:MAG TPA: DUF1684 domain-containing protein [Kofleriaceae bacterium]|nr:DUF1684 domain-containing protein [Kofleriaceae bacterium]
MDSAAEAHEREIAAFRAAREARYRSGDGWLTLIERIALDPGETRTPLGTVTVATDGSAALEVSPGLAVTRGGDPVEGTPVEGTPVEGRIDVSEGAVFVLAGRRHEIVKRSGGRLAMRVRDPESPARRRFAGIPVYPVDRAYRVAADFDRLPAPEDTTVEMSDGEEDLAHLAGEARFALPVAAGTQRLQIFIEESTGRLYVPFGDRTNRHETYGGGRFLYGKEESGTLVLDFNRACNPPCAFNPLVTCPLPPPANRLDVSVRAGERLPRGS